LVFVLSTIAVTAVAVITANVHLDYRPTGARALVLAHVAMARVHAQVSAARRSLARPFDQRRSSFARVPEAGLALKLGASKMRACEVRRYIQYDPEPRSDRRSERAL